MNARFRALRNFRFDGRDVIAGEVLMLDDDQVRELIWMPGTIEPLEACDRERVLVRPTVEWKGLDESEHGRRGESRRGYW